VRLQPVLVALLTVTVFGVAACDSDETAEESNETATEQIDTAAQELRRERRELAKERAALRRERARARRARARARRIRAAERAAAREEAKERAAEEEAAEQPPPADACHPSYDPCLDPNAADYDCDGGEGDGPEYTGPVTVKGDDPYGLDSDGDGYACEF